MLKIFPVVGIFLAACTSASLKWRGDQSTLRQPDSERPVSTAQVIFLRQTHAWGADMAGRITAVYKDGQQTVPRSQFAIFKFIQAKANAQRGHNTVLLEGLLKDLNRENPGLCKVIDQIPGGRQNYLMPLLLATTFEDLPALAVSNLSLMTGPEAAFCLGLIDSLSATDVEDGDVAGTQSALLRALSSWRTDANWSVAEARARVRQHLKMVDPDLYGRIVAEREAYAASIAKLAIQRDPYTNVILIYGGNHEFRYLFEDYRFSELDYVVEPMK